jgi:dimeric dUTPase (all-alpha-NTP-PPase superfamily)
VKEGTNMNLKQLFNMQELLDQHIEEQHQLTETNLIDKKVLALLVEVSELANETRCFKFWSVKGPSEKDIILAEYVDGIHFILSLGLALQFQDISINQPESIKEETDLTKQFLLLNKLIIQFGEQQTIDTYQELFAEYLFLGKMLGFSGEEIEKAYKDKNDINYERQKKGY